MVNFPRSSIMDRKNEEAIGANYRRLGIRHLIELGVGVYLVASKSSPLLIILIFKTDSPLI